MNIRANGELDVRDEDLAGLDWVVASVHSSFDKSPTERVLAAMENPYVDCIGHLTGRKIGKRPPSEVDVERVIEKALETGTFLEINSQPDRLDLTDVHARAAREAGLKLVIDSDGHQLSALDYVELGVGQARRAWLTKDGRRQHAHLEPGPAAQEAAAMTFRDDLGGRVRLRRVVPRGRRRAAGRAAGAAGRGAGRAARVAARAAEPFADVLRDVETLIAPALTHWNHPRFFAYFGITGSEPGILAELLIAAFNVNAMAWSSSPAATELEQVALDWLAQLLGLPRGMARAHRGHRVDLDARRARRGPRAPARRRRLRLGARELLGREGGAHPRPRVPRRCRSTTSSG